MSRAAMKMQAHRHIIKVAICIIDMPDELGCLSGASGSAGNVPPLGLLIAGRVSFCLVLERLDCPLVVALIGASIGASKMVVDIVGLRAQAVRQTKCDKERSQTSERDCILCRTIASTDIFVSNCSRAPEASCQMKLDAIGFLVPGLVEQVGFVIGRGRYS